MALVILVAIFVIGTVGAVVYFSQHGHEFSNSVSDLIAPQEVTIKNANTTGTSVNAASDVNTDVVSNGHTMANANANINSSRTNTAVSVNTTAVVSNASTNIMVQTPAEVNAAGFITITLHSVGDAFVFTDAEAIITLKSFSVSGKTADLQLSYSQGGDTRWVDSNPGATGYYPNPSTYADDLGSDLLGRATVLYRAHYYCDGTLFTAAQPVGAYEKIDLASGYSNVICRNREQEQCISDGTFDHYYDERCDYGTVTFTEGSTKTAPNFSITVNSVTSDGVEITANPLE